MTPPLIIGLICGVLVIVGCFVLSPARTSHVLIMAWLFVAFLACASTHFVINSNHASAFEAACRTAGGVPVSGTCLKKSAVLELP